MIWLKASGRYQLSESKDGSRLLCLASYYDEVTYAWGYSDGIQLRLTDQKPDETWSALVVGKYRLYLVNGEADLTDQHHLELLVGEGVWQGYILPEGFPEELTAKTMIPVKELITKSFANVRFPIH